MFKIVDQGVLSHQPGRGAFIPHITPLSDGSFIAAQHVATALIARDRHIEVLHSNNGKDWTSGGELKLASKEISWVIIAFKFTRYPKIIYL